MAPPLRGRRILLIGGVLTGIASLLHVAIIWGGPSWYRFFGAGEGMARLAARGSLYPPTLTAAIAAVLGIWAVYGLSGAGVIRSLPYQRLVLQMIAAIYLARGLLGVPVVWLVDDPYLLELRGRMIFMTLSSAVCAGLGVCYAVGVLYNPGRGE